MPRSSSPPRWRSCWPRARSSRCRRGVASVGGSTRSVPWKPRCRWPGWRRWSPCWCSSCSGRRPPPPRPPARCGSPPRSTGSCRRCSGACSAVSPASAWRARCSWRSARAHRPARPTDGPRHRPSPRWSRSTWPSCRWRSPRRRCRSWRNRRRARGARRSTNGSWFQATRSGRSPRRWSASASVVPARTSEVAAYWGRLVEANRPHLVTGDPDLIYPGQRLELLA